MNVGRWLQLREKFQLREKQGDRCLHHSPNAVRVSPTFYCLSVGRLLSLPTLPLLLGEIEGGGEVRVKNGWEGCV